MLFDMYFVLKTFVGSDSAFF